MDEASTRPFGQSQAMNSRKRGIQDSPPTGMRKVRKGTRSCWECRRRKMKCIFDSPADAACVGCQRRGAKCIDQQFPEQVSTTLERSLQIGDRVMKVEAQIEQLLKTISHNSTSDSCSRCARAQETETSNSSIADPVLGSPIPAESQSTSEILKNEPHYEILNCESSDGSPRPVSSKHRRIELEKHQALSQCLHGSLPTLGDLEIIARARGDLSARFFQMLTVPYDEIDRSDPQSLENLFEQPRTNAHPVIIGLYMLRIATFLQHLHPNLHKNLEGLSEPPLQMTRRLFNTVLSLITTDENLVSSVEGLECLMMESLWYTNCGNLRKGLVAIRRAITIAQLMGFHRSRSSAQCKLWDSDRKVDPKFIWFRIISAERHLCLMLGLPQSTADHDMASKEALENDTPMGRLERIHCVIASRILQRNQSDPSPHGFTLTKELDEELQKAATRLPRKWWLHSHLATALDEPEMLFWDMRRLFNQLFHYYLLNQLHLPYMLCSSLNEHESHYSRFTCVNASREVLSRFITFRSSDRVAFWCRTFDFLSLMAAITLLIAHLDEHCRGSMPHSRMQSQQSAKIENVLTHQRPSDRAIIEQVQESMEEVSQQNGDVLGIRSAALLRRLMLIEDEAASGQDDNISARALVTGKGPVNAFDKERGDAVRVCIPYFGTIEIARGGNISKVMPTAQNHTREHSVGDYGSVTQEHAIPENPSQTQEEFIFTTGVDDWDFQDVDMSFFDSLVGETGDNGSQICSCVETTE
ncbi:hypothetical protein V8C35DRAFT_245373 [Trichoderma chlorosporum]